MFKKLFVFILFSVLICGSSAASTITITETPTGNTHEGLRELRFSLVLDSDDVVVVGFAVLNDSPHYEDPGEEGAGEHNPSIETGRYTGTDFDQWHLESVVEVWTAGVVHEPAVELPTVFAILGGYTPPPEIVDSFWTEAPDESAFWFAEAGDPGDDPDYEPYGPHMAGSYDIFFGWTSTPGSPVLAVLYDTTTGSLFSVAGETGHAIELGASASVPEPSTMLLFGIGVIGLAGINRRKNKSKFH